MPIAQINGTTLHYRVKGSGLPILFIHPPLLEGSCFNYQLEQLSDRYQIITFDVRGHGQSPSSNSPVTYQLLTRDIEGLMDDLEIKKAVVCGYSTASSVALEALLAYPDRFYGGILLSGLSEVSDPFVKGIIRAFLAAASLRAKTLLTALISFGNADSPRTFFRLYSCAKKGNLLNHKEYYQNSLTYNCTARLKEIQAPMLLLYGEKDRSFRRYAAILQKGLVNSTLRFIPNGKHQLPTKWAGPTNRLIREWIEAQPFMKKTYPAPKRQEPVHPMFEPEAEHEEPFRQL